MAKKKMLDCAEWGPFAIRIVAGLIFLVSGFIKVSDIAGPTAFFGSLGFPVAGTLAWLVGIVELVGGAMLILGIYTRWAAVPLGIIMIVSLSTARWGDWLGGGRLDLLLLASMVSLFLTGGGKWSLDKTWRT